MPPAPRRHVTVSSDIGRPTLVRMTTNVAPPTPSHKLAPSNSWTGVGGSGFNGSPPVDPIRITAKPMAQPLFINWTTFGSDIIVGVSSWADGATVSGPREIGSAIFRLEGNGRAVTQRTTWADVDANGVSHDLFGYQVTIDYAAAMAINPLGTMELYVEIIPNDATMQHLVLGPYKLYARAPGVGAGKVNDCALTVTPGGSGIAPDYTSIKNALTFCRTTNYIQTPGVAYTNGTHTGVAMTGGSGSGKLATIVVSGGQVITVTPTTNGIGYINGDVLSATIGAGSGFGYHLGYTRPLITLMTSQNYIIDAQAADFTGAADPTWATLTADSGVSAVLGDGTKATTSIGYDGIRFLGSGIKLDVFQLSYQLTTAFRPPANSNYAMLFDGCDTYCGSAPTGDGKCAGSGVNALYGGEIPSTFWLSTPSGGTFRASMAGNTLTVISYGNGQLLNVGTPIFGHAAGVIPCTLTARGTGVGKTGTYTFSGPPQTILDLGANNMNIGELGFANFFSRYATFHDLYYGAGNMRHIGSTLTNCATAPLQNALSAFNVGVNNTNPMGLRTPFPALSITYSGAGTVPKIQRTGTNGNSGVFSLVVDGSTAGTLAIATSPLGSATRVQALADFINGVTGWSATVIDNSLSACRLVRIGDVPSASIPLTTLTKNVAYTLNAVVDAHSDVAQSFGTAIYPYISNRVFERIQGYGTVNTQGLFLDHSNVIAQDVGYVNCILQDATAAYLVSHPTSGAAVEVSEFFSTCSHVAVLNSTIDGAPFLLGNNGANPFMPDAYCAFRHTSLDSASWNVTPSNGLKVNSISVRTGSQLVTGANAQPLNSINQHGAANTTMFVNPAADNYTPTAKMALGDGSYAGALLPASTPSTPKWNIP